MIFVTHLPLKMVLISHWRIENFCSPKITKVYVKKDVNLSDIIEIWEELNVPVMPKQIWLWFPK